MSDLTVGGGAGEGSGRGWVLGGWGERQGNKTLIALQRSQVQFFHHTKY